MKLRILLFDDIKENRLEVHRALEAALDTKGEVQDFQAGVSGTTGGMHETLLLADLQTPPNTSVSLIVADRDLSSYKDGFGGLSEATVRHVADNLGVPECGYARGERDDDDEYVQRGEQYEACIRLSLKEGVERFASRVVAIAEGFVSIRENLRLFVDKPGCNSSPGNLLACVLNKPEYSDKISLYASGDQNRFGSVLRIERDKSSSIEKAACLLGYWLWDSVLRFPGVTVGVIPAGSYLDIREDIFEQDEQVQQVFSEALYNGPFAAAKIRMWWRGMLDDMISKSGCQSGRELAEKKLARELPGSQCCEDSSLRAGFYCMLKQKPVNLKNSKGGLPWFPRGADLARVSVSALEELGPWL